MDEKKALAVIEQQQKAGALIYTRPEDLQTQRMFVPQVTVIPAVPQDFHNIKGKMMPKSHHLNRIGEAAGVDFVFGEVDEPHVFLFCQTLVAEHAKRVFAPHCGSIRLYNGDVDV